MRKVHRPNKLLLGLRRHSCNGCCSCYRSRCHRRRLLRLYLCRGRCWVLRRNCYELLCRYVVIGRLLLLLLRLLLRLRRRRRHVLRMVRNCLMRCLMYLRPRIIKVVGDDHRRQVGINSPRRRLHLGLRSHSTYVMQIAGSCHCPHSARPLLFRLSQYRSRWQAGSGSDRSNGRYRL